MYIHVTWLLLIFIIVYDVVLIMGKAKEISKFGGAAGQSTTITCHICSWYGTVVQLASGIIYCLCTYGCSGLHIRN